MISGYEHRYERSGARTYDPAPRLMSDREYKEYKEGTYKPKPPKLDVKERLVLAVGLLADTGKEQGSKVYNSHIF